MSVIDSDRPVVSTGPSGNSPKSRRKGISVGGASIPYILIAPAFLVLVGVLGYPVVRLFQLSFQNVNTFMFLYTPSLAQYVGFDNFQRVLSDPEFWQSVERTVYLTAELLVISIGLGLAIAVLLNRVSRWVKTVVVTVLMFVWAIPAIVTGTIFSWLFASAYGVVDYLFTLVGFPKMENHDWFADSTVGLYGVVAVCVIWGALPFLVIGLNAAMTQVPKELVEAAKLDGAGPWQTFYHVVLPVIRPFLILATSLSFIWDFQVFAQVWSIRNNAPEPGYRVLGTYLYQHGVASNHYSDGAVIALVMILLMLAVMVFYIRQMLKIGAQD